MGKISRSRRVKSAGKLSSASSSRNLDQRRLIRSESSTSDSIDNDNEDGDLDYAENRIREVKESLKSEAKNHESEKVRPINIDVAVAQNQS